MCLVPLQRERVVVVRRIERGTHRGAARVDRIPDRTGRKARSFAKYLSMRMLYCFELL